MSFCQMVSQKVIAFTCRNRHYHNSTDKINFKLKTKDIHHMNCIYFKMISNLHLYYPVFWVNIAFTLDQHFMIMLNAWLVNLHIPQKNIFSELQIQCMANNGHYWRKICECINTRICDMNPPLRMVLPPTRAKWGRNETKLRKK